jgi:hypothetical protein
MPSAGRVVLGKTMRCVSAAVAIIVLLFSGAAQAERRMFIIANQADDYGVDRCLVSNASCGTTVANAYCHSHEYAQALSFRKVERDDIVAAISADDGGSCTGSRCGTFVAIECAR